MRDSTTDSLAEEAKIRVPGRVARDVGEQVGKEGDFEDLVGGGEAQVGGAHGAEGWRRPPDWTECRRRARKWPGLRPGWGGEAVGERVGCVGCSQDRGGDEADETDEAYNE